MKVWILAVAILAFAGRAAVSDECVLTNPTQREYVDQVIRLKLAPPGLAGSFTVERGDDQVAFQLERFGDRTHIWICSTFAPGESQSFRVAAGTPKTFPARVKVTRSGDSFVLDNGVLAVRVPAIAGDAAPGPVSAVRLGGKWVGASIWRSALKLKAFSASVVGDGTIFGKVRLRYDFDGRAGLDPFRLLGPAGTLDIAAMPSTERRAARGTFGSPPPRERRRPPRSHRSRTSGPTAGASS